jgi:hypothetical protein
MKLIANFLVAAVLAFVAVGTMTLGHAAEAAIGQPCDPKSLNRAADARNGICTTDIAAGQNTDVCIAIKILPDPPIGPGPKLLPTSNCPSGFSIPVNDAAGNPIPGGPIIFYLKEILWLVNRLVGAIVVLVLVIGGIQYITSAGDPTNVKKAKSRITAAMTALLLYFMMVAILNFLIPGGAL